MAWDPFGRLKENEPEPRQQGAGGVRGRRVAYAYREERVEGGEAPPPPGEEVQDRLPEREGVPGRLVAFGRKEARIRHDPDPEEGVGPSASVAGKARDADAEHLPAGLDAAGVVAVDAHAVPAASIGAFRLVGPFQLSVGKVVVLPLEVPLAVENLPFGD